MSRFSLLPAAPPKGELRRFALRRRARLEVRGEAGIKDAGLARISDGFGCGVEADRDEVGVPLTVEQRPVAGDEVARGEAGRSAAPIEPEQVGETEPMLEYRRVDAIRRTDIDKGCTPAPPRLPKEIDHPAEDRLGRSGDPIVESLKGLVVGPWIGTVVDRVEVDLAVVVEVEFGELRHGQFSSMQYPHGLPAAHGFLGLVLTEGL